VRERRIREIENGEKELSRIETDGDFTREPLGTSWL
jgi:hypothetical protein